MKNKVDISKLIKEKYKDNTLQLSDLFEEIDLVLQEGFSYETKNADPANMEEMSMQKYASSIVNGAGDPRQRTSKSIDTKSYGAEKIAEAGESNVPTIQGTFEMPVIDLFSMITNSKMELDDSDRELINDIINNIGASQVNSWKDRIKLIQKYTMSLGQAQTVHKMNIREAISNLMFLNLFKKLSYFTDQPSKQFEYVMAPVISPNAYVIPKDEDIADVRTTEGENFSIKFLMATTPEVKGSITRLKEHPNGLNYIFGKVFAGGILEFGECEITAYIKNINPQEYKLINTISSGMVEIYQALSDSQVPKVKIYIRTYDDDQEKKEYYKIRASFQTGDKPISQPKTLDTRTPEQQLSDIERRLRPLKRDIKNLFTDFQKNEATQTPLNKGKLHTLMNSAESFSLLDSEFSKILERFNKRTETDKLSNFDAQKELHRQLSNSYDRYVQQYLAQKKELEANKSTIKKENVDLSEQTGKKEEPQFNFRLSGGAWELMTVSSLNLGSPSIYNNQLLFFSDTISKAFRSVMENFQKLNKNLISYFGTSVERQKEKNQGKSSAQDCVDNAEQIIYGVTDIAGSEGEKVNVTNPRLTRRTEE